MRTSNLTRRYKYKGKKGPCDNKRNYSARSSSRNENDYNVRGKEGSKLADYIPVCLSHAASSCLTTANQSCSATRPVRPLGKLIRLARSAIPPRPRSCIFCSRSLTTRGNPSCAPDGILPVAGRLVYSGPRVCDGSRLNVGRDASSAACDAPLLMGEPRELLALILPSLPLPLPAGLALLPLVPVADVVGGGGGAGPVDVVLPRRRGAR